MGLKEFITLWLLSMIFMLAGVAVFASSHIIGVVLFIVGALFASENILRGLRKVWQPDAAE